MKSLGNWIGVVAFAFATAASAQSWPAKSLRMVVPFAAGGATDVVARLLAQKLGETWGQTVVVENRLGAGGNIGAEAVAKSAPDGYTLLLTSGAIVTANPFLYKSMTYDPATELVAITNVATGPQVITVGPSLQVKDLKELIAYAKANPGKLNFGSAGIGTQTHLAAEKFAHAAGIQITHVPYKGESAAMTDLIGGQIDLVTPNLGGAIGHIQQGKLRALAVTSRGRNMQFPDVPAAGEIVTGFENAGWFGLMAPAGTPRELIERIYQDAAKIVRSDEFRAKLAQQGMEPVGNSPSEFAHAIRDETARWAKVVKERGLAVN